MMVSFIIISDKNRLYHKDISSSQIYQFDLYIDLYFLFLTQQNFQVTWQAWSKIHVEEQRIKNKQNNF